MEHLNLQSSQITTFMECPRKWYYQYHLWRDVPPTHAMQRGTCFHYMCEIHFREGIEVKDLADYIAEHEPDLVRFIPEMLPAFIMYLEHYKDSDYYFHEVDGTPAIELEVKIELADDISYWMKFDSMRQRNGKIYLFDWKVTSAYLNDWFFQKFELATQTFAYSWAARELFGDDVEGFFIDAIRVPKEGKSGKIDFQRKFFPLVGMMDEFVSETCRTGRWILDHIDDEDNFEHRWTGCINKYGRKCQYADVCLAKPERRESILNSGLYTSNVPIYDFEA